MLYPSGLPRQECDMMKKSIYELLLKIGFQTGIFHVEARIRDSSMNYRFSKGIMDLHETPLVNGAHKKAPRPFLLEINARSPGQMPTWGTAFAYGIDYFGLQLLAALRDTERLEALSQPFLRGAQSWTNVVFVPTNGSGVFGSDDVFKALRCRHPELMAHVSYSRSMFRRGDRMLPLPDGSWPWVAWFVVWSRTSRSHAVELGMRIKASACYKVNECRHLSI